MFRYQILIEYVGTNFRGWQVQKKGKTIQGLIQEKISNLLKEKGTQYILDISMETSKTIKFLEEATNLFSPSEFKVVQTLAGNFNKQMISHQTALFDKLEPLIALTKLDECELSPIELSALVSARAQIALLTGTKSIVGAIAIASEAILSQYLKENC